MSQVRVVTLLRSWYLRHGSCVREMTEFRFESVLAQNCYLASRGLYLFLG